MTSAPESPRVMLIVVQCRCRDNTAIVPVVPDPPIQELHADRNGYAPMFRAWAQAWRRSLDVDSSPAKLVKG